MTRGYPDERGRSPALPTTMEPARQDLIVALQCCGTTAAYCAHAATGMSDRSECVEVCRDLAALCRTASELLSRRSSFEAWVLPTAILAAEVCARECKLHTDVFFRDCVEACESLRRMADRLADAEAPQLTQPSAGRAEVVS